MNLSPIIFLVKKNFALSRHGKLSTNERAKKKGSRPLLGAVLGIALSLIPLTVVIHISEAMIRGITDRSIETSTYHFQVYSFNEESIENIKETAQKIKKENLEIIHTHIERQGFGLVYNDTDRMGTTIRALPEDIFDKDKGFARFIEMKEGSFNLSGTRSILLGVAVAEELHASVGDKVKLLSGRILEDGTIIPKILKFTVTGIFSTGYQELDKLWTIIPFETGKILLSPENSKTLIGIKVNDPYKNTSALKQALLDSTEQNCLVFDWRDLSLSQQNSLRTTKALLIVIMIMLVFVAVINVSSSLTMVVLEQQRTIGILKCTGTAPQTITSVYLIIGTIVGVGGALLGLSTGTLFSLFINEIITGMDFLINGAYSVLRLILLHWIDISSENIHLVNTAYYLDNIPVEIEPVPLMISAFFTVSLSVVFSAFPAKNAGKIRPLDIIRKF